MVETQCPKCKRIWEYKGKKEEGRYVSCPDCHASIKLRTETKQ